ISSDTSRSRFQITAHELAERNESHRVQNEERNGDGNRGDQAQDRKKRDRNAGNSKKVHFRSHSKIGRQSANQLAERPPGKCDGEHQGKKRGEQSYKVNSLPAQIATQSKP